ncbi:MAG: type II toxin-antitoxin system RelE/ParE family toxin [Phycisphaeraceae bacterium]|nr:type II toxin-antitoxin system RelE/ParE family toxin [Phycisphaeraceae bacterium]
MPPTEVRFYAESDGSSPVIAWLQDLRRRDLRAFGACRARILLLAALGHELRRPHADLLRDGIYELRSRVGSVNYRILYFFHGKNIAIVAHGITKERAVPPREIERALERKRRYEQAPSTHVASINPQDL